MADNDAQSNDGGDSTAPGDGTQSSSSSPPRGSFITYLQEKKIDALLFCTRLATVFFTIFFIIPIVGEQGSNYNKALLSTAATSALRLHQRLPRFAFTREFFGLLLLEDSAHYLFYALIFSSAFPITLTLAPVFLFAVLHACSFIVVMCRATNNTNTFMFDKASLIINHHQVNLFRMIALTEIMVMPTTIMLLISGKGNLFLPFVYYRFLSLRYQSRRNPYSRQMFYEVRVSCEQLTQHRNCPAFVGQMLRSAIGLVCRLAPQQPPPAPPPAAAQ